LYLAHQPILLIFIISWWIIALVDGQDTMSGALKVSQKALADYFITMELQHAHWYCIKLPTIGEANCEYLKRMFLPLSSLLNILDELLSQCSMLLGCYARKEKCYPHCYVVGMIF
jgi:hypothetical protein